MRKLSRGVVRRGRSSSAKGSVVGAAAGLKTKPRKGEEGVAVKTVELDRQQVGLTALH